MGNISAALLVQAMVRVVNRIYNGVYAETSQGATSLGATSQRGIISAALLVQALVRVVNRIYNGVYAETSQGATFLGQHFCSTFSAG